jgi:hypothetical protein
MNILDDLPAVIEWRIYKGDSGKVTMFVNDGSNNPVDLSDYTVTGQVRERQEDATALVELAIVTVDNIISFEVPDTTVLPKTSFFDIQTVKDGITKTIMAGKIIATLDVTR